MFEPIKALFASSCSKKGIKEVETLTSCIGDISIKSTVPAGTTTNSSPFLISIPAFINSPLLSMGELA